MFNPVDECFGHLPAFDRATLKRRRAKIIVIVSSLLAIVILGGMALQVLL